MPKLWEPLAPLGVQTGGRELSVCEESDTRGAVRKMSSRFLSTLEMSPREDMEIKETLPRTVGRLHSFSSPVQRCPVTKEKIKASR